MKTTTGLALPLALALSLAACGGTAENAATTPAEPTIVEATTAQAAPTPEPTGATVNQWASKIAPLKVDWQEQQDSWDDAICSPSVAADAEGLDCQAYLAAMYFTAETISITVEGLAKPGGPTDLGDPPAEIANLYDETSTAARMAAEAGDAVDCPGDDCVSTAFQFTRAWDDLGDAFAAWEPYL